VRGGSWRPGGRDLGRGISAGFFRRDVAFAERVA
jgi:hypothetical protein